MSNVNDQIESRIRSFVAELNVLVRQSALAAVQGALGGGTASSSARRGPGRPPKSAKAHAAPSAKLPARRGKKGGKRPPALLAKTVEALRHHVAQHPGRRIEQIAPALGVKTKDLALPVHKLLAAKAITRKGQKRATTYWPAK